MRAYPPISRPRHQTPSPPSYPPTGGEQGELVGIVGRTDLLRALVGIYRSAHLGHAVRAIDAYFVDLRGEFGHLLPEVILNSLRASSVLVPKLGFPQSHGNVVGATGIEPVTPAMSTQCSYR